MLTFEKIIFAVMGMAIVVVAFAIGCANGKPEALQDPKPAIIKTEGTLKTSSDELIGDAKQINTSTDAIHATVPVDVQKKIEPRVKELRDTSMSVSGVASRLLAALPDLSQSRDQIAQLQRENQQLADDKDAVIKANARLKAKNESLVTRILAWSILLSVIGIGVAFALFWQGNRYAIVCGVGSFAALITATFAITFMTYLLIAGGVLLLAAIGFAVYELYVHRKAVTELVQTGELAKQNMAPQARAKVFGVGADGGRVQSVQSDSTQALVDRVRGVADQNILLAPSIDPATAAAA